MSHQQADIEMNDKEMHAIEMNDIEMDDVEMLKYMNRIYIIYI